jgi:hypothetical protein
MYTDFILWLICNCGNINWKLQIDIPSINLKHEYQLQEETTLSDKSCSECNMQKTERNTKNSHTKPDITF